MRRLGWAGIEIEAEGETLVIDHILEPGALRHFLGPDPDPLIAPQAGRASGALVTHLHRDHADAAALEAALAPGAAIYRPPPTPAPSRLDAAATGEAEEGFAAVAVPTVNCRAGDRHRVGPFEVVALAASDGLGSPQISWLVEADGTTVLHAGDTIWHGHWWNFVEAHGPVDLACLPANGVEAAYPGWEPAVEVPIVMTPAQAIEAATALRAATTVPIHFSRTFEHPEYYRPVRDAEGDLRRLAADRDLRVEFLEPGRWFEIENRPAP